MCIDVCDTIPYGAANGAGMMVYFHLLACLLTVAPTPVQSLPVPGLEGTLILNTSAGACAEQHSFATAQQVQ